MSGQGPPRWLWTRRTLLRRVTMGVAGAISAGPVATLLENWIQPTRFVYVGADACIAVYATAGGKWLLRQTVPCEKAASLAIHPSGRFLYAAHAVERFQNLPRGAVGAYAIHPASGRLTLLNRQPLSLSATSPRSLAIAPDGRHLVVAAYGGGAYNLLPIAGDGALQRVSGILKQTGAGADPQTQSCSHPHTAIFDSSGQFLIGSDFGSDRLNVLAVRDGELLGCNRRDTAPGSGPSSLVLHPAGDRLYAMNLIAGSIACHPYDPTSGRIGAPLQVISTGRVSKRCGFVSSALQFHPRGRALYAVDGSYPSEQAIASWRVDPLSGFLLPLERWRCAARSISSLSLTPGAASLLLTDRMANRVLRLHLDPVTGAMGRAELAAELASPLSIACQR